MKISAVVFLVAFLSSFACTWTCGGALPSAAIAPGTTFTQTGLKATSSVVYDADVGELVLFSVTGTTIIFR